MTSSWLLVSFVGRALHLCHKGHGFKSHKGLNFFRLYFHYCLSSVHYCEEGFHIQVLVHGSSYTVSADNQVFCYWSPLIHLCTQMHPTLLSLIVFCFSRRKKLTPSSCKTPFHQSDGSVVGLCKFSGALVPKSTYVVLLFLSVLVLFWLALFWLCKLHVFYLVTLVLTHCCE